MGWSDIFEGVSMCNGNKNDDRFCEKLGRFLETKEKKPPYWLSSTECQEARRRPKEGAAL